MALTVTCPRCGREAGTGAAFCGSCGGPLRAPGRTRPRAGVEDRRRISVLFIDVVNFTGFTERSDPERVRLMQTAFFGDVRDVVCRYGGVVEKYIGDAVMVLFGAPVTTETDTVRCVRAALELQRALARADRGSDAPSEFRIGIATGDALVDSAAARDGGHAIAAGDVINTASRLQSLASPGGVLVDDITHQATRRSIRFREREPVTLRGHSAPTRVWVPVAPLDGPSDRDRHDTPLVNRTHELDLLTGALRRSVAERTPRLVTLFGRAGIGKSRLVRELSHRAGGSLRWRVGHCPPFGENVTYAAFAEVVKAEAGILDTDDADTTRSRLRAAVSAVVPHAEVARLAAALGPLVGLPGDLTLTEDIEWAWRRFIVALATQRPSVLVIEDLHWADQTMVDFVERLGNSIRDVPLLVLCTSRPELLDREPAWAGAVMGSQTITLDPLTDDHMTTMLAAMLAAMSGDRPPMPGDVLARLVPLSGGNPLYAHEYFRMLLERGTLDGPAGDGPDSAIDGRPMPDNVLAVIANRLDLLDPDDRAVLQAGAVVGMQFWAVAVAATLDRPVAEVERALRRLERRDLVTGLTTSSMAGHAEYRFQHVLVRDVCYQRLTRTDRIARHVRAADWLEGAAGDRAIDHAETLANHRFSAHEIARTLGVDTAPYAPAAQRALYAAARRAYGLHALGVAANHVRRALTLFGAGNTSVERLELEVLDAELSLLQDADRFLADGGVDRLDGLVDALRPADAPRTTAQALTLRGQAAWLSADHDTALACVRSALDLLADEPDSEQKATAHAELARLHMISNEYAEAIRAADAATTMADRLGLVEVRASAMITAGTSRYYQGDPGAVDTLRGCMAECRALTLPSLRRALRNLGNILHEEGDLAGGTELLLEHRSMMTSDGHSLDASYELDGLIAYFDGEWDTVVGAIEERRGHAWDLHSRAQGAWMRVLRRKPVAVDGAEGCDDAEASLRVAERSGYDRLLWTALAHGALCRGLQGRRAEAERLLVRLVERWRAVRNQPSGEWIAAAGHAAALLGGRAAAALLTMLDGSPRETAWTRGARLSAAGGAASTDGDPATAAERHADAARVYRSMPNRTEEAIALSAAARAYRAAGRPDEAEPREARLAEFVARSGATVLLDLARLPDGRPGAATPHR